METGLERAARAAAELNGWNDAIIIDLQDLAAQGPSGPPILAVDVSGTFGVNGYTVMPNVPFGGTKASGLGREGGQEGIDAFLETKTVMMNLGETPY